MSNALRFIEEMGALPHAFAGAGREARYLDAVQGGQFPGDVSRALVERDVQALGEALGGRKVMMMQVWAPQEDDAPQEGEVPVRSPQRDDDENGDPDRNA